MVFVGILEILVVFMVGWVTQETVFLCAKIFVLFNIVASVFNLVAAIIYYKKGNKEARFYILGFGVLFLIYLAWTLETLRFSNFIYEHPNTIIIGTTIEALILSIAFADRYLLLQKAKESVDKQILQELLDREKIIKNEVLEKTKQFKNALDNKALLLKELRQNFLNLENRINAIAKSYDKLLVKENLEEIDMKDYIQPLLKDIKTTTLERNSNIKIITNINAVLSLQKSTYVGLLLNELITNAYKYAFDKQGGVIEITLMQKGDNIELIFKDNGKGFDPAKIKQNSLGLKLIDTLVVNQLGGKIKTIINGGAVFIIVFPK